MQKLTFVQFFIVKLEEKESKEKLLTRSIEVPKKIYDIYASTKHQNDIGGDVKSVVKELGEKQAQVLFEKIISEGNKVIRLKLNNGYISVFLDLSENEESILEVTLNGMPAVELSEFGARQLLIDFYRSFVYKFIELSECKFD